MRHYECNKAGCDSYYVGECPACQEKSEAQYARAAADKERDRLWLQQRGVFEARLEAAEAVCEAVGYWRGGPAGEFMYLDGDHPETRELGEAYTDWRRVAGISVNRSTGEEG